MPDEMPPVEKAVALLVYAPVGMALYVRDMLPGMMGIFVARGKREVQSHRTPPPPPSPPPLPDEVKRRIDESVGIARVVAESGFGLARDVAGSGVGVARDVAGSALSGLLANRPGGARTSETETQTETSAPSSAESWATPSSDVTAPESAPEPGPTATPPDAEWSAPAPDVESLPIPDYDELSAPQVVERLDGLAPESLEAIRRYETAHRGRKTILGKISQLS